MKNQNRLIQTKEVIYYILGILLIFGFVYLYWSHFADTFGPPHANRLILSRWGKNAAIAINAAIFFLFILFLPFRDRIEWRSKGMFSAFILALFAEMFGVPLLIYILHPLGGADLARDIPVLKHVTVFLYRLRPDWPAKAIGVWMTLSGMLLVFWGWIKIHKSEGLVTSSIYKYIRHPQYTGIFLIITGWMCRWYTSLTFLMYPILLVLYYKLARREEKLLQNEFGDAYLIYKEATPMFFPIKLPSRRKKIAKQTPA
jgi:protein-S-isoprenylcysteine O-methyltransferase Ste14